MLLFTLAHKTVLSISQNGINQITLNKQLGNHLNMDIINASTCLMKLFCYVTKGVFGQLSGQGGDPSQGQAP